MHKIEQRAVVHDGTVVARPMMYIALSYDHRIIDGKDSVSFLRTIKEILEDPTKNLARFITVNIGNNMNLHEYQAKELFRQYGLPVPESQVASTVAQALAAGQSLATETLVVKAQVHAGGRGKAGGVKLVHSLQELEDYTKTILGTNLVTYQTDASGQPVNQVLVEATCDIASELYLGAVLDRKLQQVVIMASTEGGVDIETVAEQTPEKIHKVAMCPMLGVMPYQARELAFALV